MAKFTNLSRRSFLKTSTIVAGTATLGGMFHSPQYAHAQNTASTRQSSDGMPVDGAVRGRMFFTNALQFSTISQAAERIFPKDDTGPGAIELAVPFFIDNQLAGAYGMNAAEYMSGPFKPGAPEQGYQTSLLRKDIFLQGINALNSQSQAMFKKDFPDLTDAQKDQILQLCQDGKINTEGFTSSYFFSLLRDMVIAGAYADPIYSGNNNMDGWRMKDYPGAQMDYMGVIDSPAYQSITPMSLADMQ